MNAHEIAEAAKVVGWVAEQASSPENQFDQREQMGMLLMLAQSYLLEFAIHVAEGKTPAEAASATAAGDLNLRHADFDIREAPF